jgi:hypothetical protein
MNSLIPRCSRPALAGRIPGAATERRDYSAQSLISLQTFPARCHTLTRLNRVNRLAGAPRHMDVDLPQTSSKIDGPLVKQFSIFLPNKVGAMLDVVKLLHTHSTHVVALSISESTDSAIARIVVSDPEQVEELFRQHNVAFGVCSMVVVELREVATQLAKLLAALLMAEVNVHFTYPLLTHPRGFAALALHVDDTDCASSVLLGEGFKLLSQTDISR